MQSQALVGKNHTLSTFVNSTTQTAAYLDIGCGRPLLMLHSILRRKDLLAAIILSYCNLRFGASV